MMYKVIDNFFDNPDAIRLSALQLKFEKLPGVYPGFRAFVKDSSIIQKIKDAIKTNTNIDVDENRLDCAFQLSPAYYESGWVHRDDNCEYAGVVYLNKNTLIEAGTSLYKKNSVFQESILMQLQKHKIAFYTEKDRDKIKIRKYRDFFNSNFEKTVNIDNIFNRMFMYKASQLHCENKFFGIDKETSRLTLVFFYRKQKLDK